MTVDEAITKAGQIEQPKMACRALELLACITNKEGNQDTLALIGAAMALGFEAGRIFELGSMTYGDIPLETRTAELPFTPHNSAVTQEAQTPQPGKPVYHNPKGMAKR